MPFVQTNPIQMLDNKADALVVREKVGGINYVEIDTLNGTEVIRLLPTGIGDIRCFVGSAEGITRYLGISGYKTSGSLTEARLGVGVHADQVLSIYNAAGYYFDNVVDINGALTVPTIYGSAVSSGDLRLVSTSHATVDKIYLGKDNNNYYRESEQSLYINNIVFVLSGLKHKGDTDTGLTFFTDRQAWRSGGNWNIDMFADKTRICPDGDMHADFFVNSDEGQTEHVSIHGWRTSGTSDAMLFAVGVHADQVGSIYGCANGYYFDQMIMVGDATHEAWNTSTWSVIQIGATGALLCETVEATNRSMYYCQNAYVEESTWKHIVNDKSSAYLQYDGNHYLRVAVAGVSDSTIIWRNAYVCYNDPKHFFEIADNTSTVFKIAEGANTYFSINSNTGSRQMNYGTIASTRHSFEMYTSDALAFRIGVDDQDWFVIDTSTPKIDIGNVAADLAYNFLGDGNILGHHVLDTSVPPNPVAGSCYYDDTGAGGTFYIYDGAAWDYVAFSPP